jgi:hypothetical protein
VVRIEEMKMVRWWLPVLALALMPAPGAGILSASAQEDGVVVFAEAKETEQNDQPLVQVDVRVRDVSDLGAFGFIMTFNGDVLEFQRVERGEFLGSSDREVFCQDPTVDTNVLRYFCTTLGETPRQGAEGDGLLATVFFAIQGDGPGNIEFSQVQLATPPGEEIPATSQPGVIEVKDGDDTNWLPFAIGGVAAAAVVGALAAALLIRRRSIGRAAPADLPPAEGA